MRAPTSYAGPRAKVKKPKQVSQSIEKKLAGATRTVGHILSSKGDGVISLKSSDSVESAIQTLHQKRIGAVLILDNGGLIEGILSERDIVQRLADRGPALLGMSVAQIMTRNVQTCSSDEAVSSVMQTMTKGRFRHMPVVEGDQVAGIITIGDVVKHRVNELEQETLEMKQVIVG